MIQHHPSLIKINRILPSSSSSINSASTVASFIDNYDRQMREEKQLLKKKSINTDITTTSANGAAAVVTTTTNGMHKFQVFHLYHVQVDKYRRMI